jgi:Kef-type K+ transport system membrane component KefB
MGEAAVRGRAVEVLGPSGPLVACSMSLTTAEIARVVLALGLLLIAAHSCGQLCARFRQPPVIGEILGGLILGPTIFGALFPELQAQVFPTDGASAPVLGAIYQLGLFLLMFAAGAELRSVFHRGERKTATYLTLGGTLLPFIVGIGLLQVIDLNGFQGSAGNDTAFLLVVAIAIAVTSIPVISRIMLDLGILETAFARIVLTAAVIEDVALYVVLAVALGLVSQAEGDDFGLAALLNLDPASGISMAYHVIVSLAFFGCFLWLGPKLVGRLARSPYNPMQRRNPVAFQLTFMFALTGLALFAGITPLFGALVAGMVIGVIGEQQDAARDAIKSFAFAFFVPIYFAIVGLRLDLIHDFNLLLVVGFIGFACVVKALSAYGGARLAGQNRSGATNLAVAMNARGGPGIVLASVAFDGGIINEELFVTFVLLAVLTSLAAGTWLEHVIKSGRPLLGIEPVTPRFEAPDGATLGPALGVRQTGGPHS